MSLPTKTTQLSFFELDHNLHTSTIVIDDDLDYNALCKFIKTYVNNDCRALTINDEVIFNSYNELTSFQGQIFEDMLRDQIIKNPHRNLFSLVHRDKTNKQTGELIRKEGVIRIYMMEEPHLQIIEIHFDPERMVYFFMVYNGKFE
jgi:hypothetical protein